MSWNRWSWLSGLGFLFVAAAGAAQTSPDREEATVRAMVFSIYASYAPGEGATPPSGYSASTADLIQKYESLTQNQSKAPLSGFDYYCECQAYGTKEPLLLSVNIARVEPSFIDATAEYVMSKGARSRKTRIRFVKSDSWVVHNVFWADGTDLRGVLKSVLAGTWTGWPSAAQRVAATSAAKDPGCLGGAHCLQEPSFVATVTDLHESVTSSLDPARVITVSLRFRNTTSEPLILAYGNPRPTVTDDRGNHYVLTHYGRGGPGIVDEDVGMVDPSFVVKPGESRDGTLEFSWKPRGAMVGRSFALNFVVAEGEPNGDQWIPGRVNALEFKGFDEPPLPAVATPAVEAVATRPVDNATSSSVSAPAATAANSNACGNRPNCFSAEYFTAEITRVSNPPAGFREVQFTVRFVNRAPRPLVLAYRPKSTIVLDDQGNRYAPNLPGMTEVSAMGVDQGPRTEPIFVLQPGEAREATYTTGLRPGAKSIGDNYRVQLFINVFEFSPDQQLQELSWARLDFRDVSMSRWQKLRGALDPGTKR